MSELRELGDLSPIRRELEWLRGQTAFVGLAPETLQLLNEAVRRLSDAIAEAEHPALPADGLTVAEYAELYRMKPGTVYQRIRRGQLQARKRGHEIRIPLEQAA